MFGDSFFLNDHDVKNIISLLAVSLAGFKFKWQENVVSYFNLQKLS